MKFSRSCDILKKHLVNILPKDAFICKAGVHPALNGAAIGSEDELRSGLLRSMTFFFHSLFQGPRPPHFIVCSQGRPIGIQACSPHADRCFSARKRRVMFHRAQAEEFNPISAAFRLRATSSRRKGSRAPGQAATPQGDCSCAASWQRAGSPAPEPVVVANLHLLNRHG